jgi:hypothetical protein
MSELSPSPWLEGTSRQCVWTDWGFHEQPIQDLE